MTAAYLPPIDAPPEGRALVRILQQWVVGVTGMPGTMVRPRWSGRLPDIPDVGNAWAAIGITETSADTFAYTDHHHDAVAGGSDVMRVTENFVLLASFYDLGSEGMADALARRLRDGAQIAQNREALQASGIEFVGAGPLTAVPTLLKQRWLYRVDCRVELRRQFTRTYAVPTITSAETTLHTSEGETVSIIV